MSDEKGEYEHSSSSIDDVPRLPPSGLPEIEYDEKEEKWAVWKMDSVLLPIMALFYFLSYVDKANIGNARIAGLQFQLLLTNQQYSECITTTYVLYIASQFPGVLVLRKIGARRVIPVTMVLWGMCSALQGTVTNFSGLIALRAFLGVTEGPVLAAIAFILSEFYTRKELSLRIAMFFGVASLSGAFSGLLASAILNMDGVGGKPGWRWIFILEGCFTVLVGFFAYWIVPNTVDHVKFLTLRQKQIIKHRLAVDRPTVDVHEKFSWKQVGQGVISPHVIFLSIAQLMNGLHLYGLAQFLPTIVEGLGFTVIRTQLLGTGPYGAGFVITITTAFIADRYKMRAIPILFTAALAIVGFALFLTTTDKWIAYGSLFMAVSGGYATPSVLTAWLANNSEPHYRRAGAIASGFVMTNVGGITSTWIYPLTDAPRFTQATRLNLSCASILFVLVIFNTMYLIWANKYKIKHRDELLEPYYTRVEHPEDTKGGSTSSSQGELEVERAWIELGDRHPEFVYVI